MNPQLKSFLMGAATVVVGVALYDFLIKPQVLKLSMKTPPSTK
jgi:hypothetical protein